MLTIALMHAIKGCYDELEYDCCDNHERGVIKDFADDCEKELIYFLSINKGDRYD